jgi:hypothetical protein
MYCTKIINTWLSLVLHKYIVYEYWWHFQFSAEMYCFTHYSVLSCMTLHICDTSSYIYKRVGWDGGAFRSIIVCPRFGYKKFILCNSAKCSCSLMHIFSRTFQKRKGLGLEGQNCRLANWVSLWLFLVGAEPLSEAISRSTSIIYVESYNRSRSYWRLNRQR